MENRRWIATPQQTEAGMSISVENDGSLKAAQEHILILHERARSHEKTI
jgi:hypothetical protein